MFVQQPKRREPPRRPVLIREERKNWNWKTVPCTHILLATCSPLLLRRSSNRNAHNSRHRKVNWETNGQTTVDNICLEIRTYIVRRWMSGGGQEGGKGKVNAEVYAPKHETGQITNPSKIETLLKRRPFAHPPVQWSNNGLVTLYKYINLHKAR